MPYDGPIPVAELYIGAMAAGQERRGQGADNVHEYMRLTAAENRGKMSQAQALGFQVASEAGSGSTRARSNPPMAAGGGVV